jgi:hypothetical protein
MFNSHRFFLSAVCFMVVMLIPWRTETILTAEVTITSNTAPKQKFNHTVGNLRCTASVCQGMELSSGQDAIFFPESDTINPFYVSLQKMKFINGVTRISGSAAKINQVYHGTLNGLISIKGERKSLLMRAYSYLSKS